MEKIVDDNFEKKYIGKIKKHKMYESLCNIIHQLKLDWMDDEDLKCVGERPVSGDNGKLTGGYEKVGLLLYEVVFDNPKNQEETRVRNYIYILGKEVFKRVAFRGKYVDDPRTREADKKFLRQIEDEPVVTNDTNSAKSVAAEDLDKEFSQTLNRELDAKLNPKS